MAKPAPEPWTNRTPKSTNLKAKTLILLVLTRHSYFRIGGTAGFTCGFLWWVGGLGCGVKLKV